MAKQDAYISQIMIPSGRTVMVDTGNNRREFKNPYHLTNVQPFVEYADDEFGYLPVKIWPMPNYLEITDEQGVAVCRVLNGSFNPVSGIITAKPEAVQFFEV